MIDRLQETIDELWSTSAQRLALAAACVVTGVGASAVIAPAAGRDSSWVSLVVAVLAVAAAVFPGTHIGIEVVGVVVWQWLAVGDDLPGWASLVVALLLLVFHTLLALMAVTSHRTVLPGAVLRRWLARGGPVIGATVAVWVLVTVLERLEVPGNVPLTLAGIAVLAAGAAWLHPSAPTHRRPDG